MALYPAKTSKEPSPFDYGVRFLLVISSKFLSSDNIKHILCQHGFIVLMAHDGAEAVDLAPMFPFAAIITDMSGADSLLSLEQIRGIGGCCAHVPMICLYHETLAPLEGMPPQLGMKPLAIDDDGYQPLIDFLTCIQPVTFGEYPPCR
jgi:hypothetical protein